MKLLVGKCKIQVSFCLVKMVLPYRSEMMRKLIDGEYDPEEFSFDFEGDLAFYSEQLKEENFELYDLLSDNMPDICANFESNEAERRYYAERKDYPKLLDEKQLIEMTKEVYEKALRFIR